MNKLHYIVNLVLQQGATVTSKVASWDKSNLYEEVSFSLDLHINFTPYPQNH